MERDVQRIVFAGGGTGGHLYPALSVAREFERRSPAVSIVFVGARRGLEQKLIPAEGYPLFSLSLAGLKGAGVAAKLAAAASAGWAVLRSAIWMLRRRPDLVIGVGGYASGPAVLAAKVLGVKTMVLEQNHYPGATNRWLAPRVDAVCLPSEAALAHVRGKTHVTGNPVRREFFRIGPPPAGEELSLLVFGGSRGAHSINRAMTATVEALAAIDPPPRIVHQTGENDLAEVRAAYAAAYPEGRYDVRPFLDDMPRRLGQADLVLCRSGASTIAELCAAGRPAILVPYPHAADDHQRHNAETLERCGGAVVIADDEMTGPRLGTEIERLAADPERRRTMGLAVRELSRPRAAGDIVDIAEGLLRGGDGGARVS